MPKRVTKIVAVISKQLYEHPEHCSIGHPCGFIAPGPWLGSRPKYSVAVGDFLLNDASFAGDFETMLIELMLCNGEVSSKVKKHLRFWARKGCPTWQGADRRLLLEAWWREWSNLLFEGKRAPGDVWDYYRTVAFSALALIQELAHDGE
jgi:hypothetical protein